MTAGPGIERWAFDVPGFDALTVFASRFSAAAFDPAAFVRQGVPCPPRIAASAPRRQADFLHGRLAATAALRHLGHEVRDIPAGTNREPVWPGGTVGSITHTAGLAAAVALPSGAGVRVGIDLERLAGGDALDALVRAVVSADERRRIVPHDDAPTLTAVFSAKESFYKAAFAEVGRFFDFDALAFERLDAQTGSMDFVLREDLSPRLRTGRPVTVHHAWIEPGVVLTVCLLPASG